MSRTRLLRSLVSLLVATSLEDAGFSPDQPDYVPMVMLLSLMIGVMHCLMAALNLGVLVRLLSDSVLAGFTSVRETAANPTNQPINEAVRPPIKNEACLEINFLRVFEHLIQKKLPLLVR